MSKSEKVGRIIDKINQQYYVPLSDEHHQGVEEPCNKYIGWSDSPSCASWLDCERELK